MSFDRGGYESQMDRTRSSMWSAPDIAAATHEEPPVSMPPVRTSDMAQILQEVARERERPECTMSSASELAYGATGFGSARGRTQKKHTTVVAQPSLAGHDESPSVEAARRREAMGRYERSYQTADQAVTAIDTLAPGYTAARDQLNVAAVAELGGQLLGTFEVAHGAMAALEKIQPTLPNSSIAGVGADDALGQFQRREAIEHDLPALQQRVKRADATVAGALTPHSFRGHEVAGRPVVVELKGPASRPTAMLAGELQRTIELVQAVADVKATLESSQRGLDEATVDRARAKLARWAGRPLDLAFLRAALGPTWHVLDEASGGSASTKPGDLMAHAALQATETGWLGDAGRFNIHRAGAQLLLGGGRAAAEAVIADLNTADPDTRATLLMQIRKRGLLDALCSSVGWAQVKQLHDGLGYGFADIKHALRPYFLGKRKFGPGLDSEWENHDSSLHGAVGRLGRVGQGLNMAVDLGTFGFHSAYGQALDDHSRGVTSESEARDATQHAVIRTAVIAAASAATGGLADKAMRGGATTVTMGRAIAAGAVSGSVGGVTEVATADLYNNYISGTQNGASSARDYVTALLMGGAGGAVLGGIAQRSSRKSAAATPEVDAVLEPPIGGPFREPSPAFAEVSKSAPLDLHDPAKRAKSSTGGTTPAPKTSADRWIEDLRSQLDVDAGKKFEEVATGKSAREIMEVFNGDFDLAQKSLGNRRTVQLPDTADRFTVGILPKSGPARWKYLEDPAHWTPDRAALHERLIANAKSQAQAFADQFVGKDPTLYAMRGNTAAGKTRAVSGNVEAMAGPMQATKNLPHRAVNPDNFKADLLGETPGATSTDVHAESSMLAGRLEKELLGMTTVDGQPASMLVDKRLLKVDDVRGYAEMARASGRKFVLYDVDAPLEHSLAGVLERTPGGADPLPPFEVVADGFEAVRANREEVMALFDDPATGSYHLYGTTARGDRVAIATIEGGHRRVMNKDLHGNAITPPKELPATKRITSESTVDLTRNFPSERSAKIRGILDDYDGWTWKAALDAHSREKTP